MNKFLSSFKSKSFRYGSFSAITVVVVIAAVIILNLIFTQLDLKLDLTKDKTYSISDESRQIINEMDDDITIYALFKTGSEGVISSYQPFEPQVITELLDQYKDSSANINLVYKDPYLYPSFASQYEGDGEGVELGSIIVENGDRYKVIHPDELYTTEYSYDSYGYPSEQLKSIDVEPKITNAIRYVTKENIPTVYSITGHNETGASDNIKKNLEAAGYAVEELDLLKETEIPEDCSVLLMTRPLSSDYNEKETETIKDYLANDGRGIIVTGSYVGYANTEAPNFTSIMSAYGVTVSDSEYIFENDSDYMIDATPINMIPKQQSSDITSSRVILWGDMSQYYYATSPIRRVEKKNTTQISSILTSSKKSRVVSSSTGSYEEEGPYDIGVTITDSDYNVGTTKLVVLSSLIFLDDSVDQMIASGGNSKYIVSCVDWLNDSSDNVYIQPKSITNESIQIDNATIKYVFAGICCIIVPFGLLIAGFIVWLRRRNK